MTNGSQSEQDSREDLMLEGITPCRWCVVGTSSFDCGEGLLGQTLVALLHGLASAMKEAPPKELEQTIVSMKVYPGKNRGWLTVFHGLNVKEAQQEIDTLIGNMITVKEN